MQQSYIETLSHEVIFYLNGPCSIESVMSFVRHGIQRQSEFFSSNDFAD